MMAVVESRHVRGGPDTTGGQDVAILFATRIGHVVLGLLIQATLAYTLLTEGRGAYSVCVVFGSLLGLVFSPGAQQGAQYFVAARQASVSQGVGAAAAISLAGGGLAIALAIPLIDSDIAFFQKAETRSFHLGLVLAPLVALSTAIEHLLAALRRFGRLAVRVLLRMSVNAIAILVLVRWWGLGVDGAVASFAIGHLVSVAACLGDLRRHCGLVAEGAVPLGSHPYSRLRPAIPYGAPRERARTARGRSRARADREPGRDRPVRRGERPHARVPLPCRGQRAAAPYRRPGTPRARRPLPAPRGLDHRRRRPPGARPRHAAGSAPALGSLPAGRAPPLDPGARNRGIGRYGPVS